MTRKMLAAVVAVGLCAARTASAQPEWLLALSLGGHIPRGDDYTVGTGWVYGIELDHRAGRNFGYGLDFFYNTFNSVSGEFEPNADYAIFQFGAHVTGFLEMGALEPYGQIGLAYYHRNAEAATPPEGDVGLGLVGGIQYFPRESRMGIAVDASIHNLFRPMNDQYVNLSGKVIAVLSGR